MAHRASRHYWKVGLGCALCLLIQALPGYAASSSRPAISAPELHDPPARAALKFHEVLPNYVRQQRQQPLHYEKLSTQTLGDVTLHRYRLFSQHWPAQDNTAATTWAHQVEIYIPRQVRTQTALLFINNGTNHIGGAGRPTMPPTDIDSTKLQTLSTATQTIVVTISDVPNQYLTLPDLPALHQESRLVAASWQLFLNHPAASQDIPLELPMVVSVIKAMDLAEAELKNWQIRHFVVTGFSKRARAAWLTTLVDTRVQALVSLAMDIRLKALYDFILRTYGGSYPGLVAPYLQPTVYNHRHQPEYTQLMQIVDPFSYLSTSFAPRLHIPKYLVTASGDEFFPADAQQLFLDDLPGVTTLRSIPNSNHLGIRAFVTASLIPVLNRWNQAQTLPKIHAQLHEEGQRVILRARSSEPPTQVRLWEAANRNDRDFRYPCSSRYHPKVLPYNNEEIRLELTPAPKTGWAAAFLEFTFADGFIATTPVYIYPSQRFPKQPPPSGGGTCQIISAESHTYPASVTR